MMRTVACVALLLAVARSVEAVTTATNALGQVQTFAHDDAGLLSGYADAHGEIGIARGKDNQISRIVDRLGGVYSFEYDTNHNVTAFTDPLSNRVSVSYNAFRQPLTITNALGAVWQNTYDAAGNLLAAVDPLGQRTERAYDAFGQVTALTDARGHTTRLAYDAFGAVTNVLRPGDLATQLEVDALGRAVAVRDPEGGVARLVYDAAGNVLAATNALGLGVRFAYDGNGNMTNAVDPRGFALVRVFDAANRLVETHAPDGGVWRNAYDANGYLSAVTDPRSNRTARTYLQGGLLASVSNAVGLVTRNFYDGQGRAVSNSLPGGRIVRSEYDVRGQLVRRYDPLDNRTDFAYDAAGRLAAVTNPAGEATSYTYDALGRLTGLTNALGHGLATAYDANGNVTALLDALGNATTFEYDALNRVTVRRDALGNALRYRYDGNGRVVEETSPRGHGRQSAYDAAGRLSRATDALGNAVSYGYDEAGRLTSLTNARAAAWTWAYDPLGRLTSEADANGNVTSNRYDLAGNRVETRTPNGAVVRFGYDAANRLTSADYGAFSNVVTYDAAGFVSRSECGGAVQTREYDLAGRLTVVNTSLASRVLYAYDAAGRLARMTYPGSRQLLYAYDRAGRCTNLLDWAGRATRFEYDAANRLTRTVFPNGVEERRAYDAAGRLTRIGHELGGTNLVAVAYAYDAAGNPTEIATEGGLARTLRSDARSGSYDADNRVTRFGTNGVYASDLNGNVTNYAGAAGATALAYDARDLLTGIRAPGLTVTNVYNGLGQRVARVKNGVETRYALDVSGPMERVVAELNAADIVQRYYVHGPGGLLYSSTSLATTLRTYHGDLTGNVLALCDRYGAVQQRYAYDPYGRVLASAGSVTNDEYQYVGKYGVMAEGGDLLFMRARYFSIGLFVFLGKDVRRSLNRYTYCNRMPSIRIDPSGQVVESVIMGAFAFGAGFAGGLVSSAIVSIISDSIGFFDEDMADDFRKDAEGALTMIDAAGGDLITLGGSTIGSVTYWTLHDAVEREANQVSDGLFMAFAYLDSLVSHYGWKAYHDSNYYMDHTGVEVTRSDARQATHYDPVDSLAKIVKLADTSTSDHNKFLWDDESLDEYNNPFVQRDGLRDYGTSSMRRFRVK